MRKGEDNIKKIILGMLAAVLISNVIPIMPTVYAEDNSTYTKDAEEIVTPSDGQRNIEEETSKYEFNDLKDTKQEPRLLTSSQVTAKLNVDAVNLTKNSLRIEGWALCDDLNARVEVVVDGKIVSYNLDRIDRPDVLDSEKGYGGATSNPKPGFLLELTDQNYGIGNHTVEVRIVSNMKILEYDTRTISLGTPKATMQIDNLSITRNNLVIQGWSMSNAGNARIELVVDGRIISTSLPRSERNDILSSVSGYGDRYTTPKPGYTFSIDQKFTAGNHHVEIRTVSGLNILSTLYRTVSVGEDKAKINLENASISSDKISINGWAMSTDAKSRVEIVLDGKIITTSAPRTSRSDILNSILGYGNSYTTPNPGYTFKQNKSFSTGNHQLEVRVVSSDMRILAATYKTLYVEGPKAILNIDNINLGSKSFSLSGWSMSTATNARVEVVVDGKILSTSLPRSQRNDILSNIKGYGNSLTTPNPGFMYNFNQNFTAGYHNVEVRVVSGTNIMTAVYKRMKVEPYKAKLNIDNLTLTDKGLTVNGWAMSTDALNRVEIVVDGKILTPATPRTTRADVLGAVTGYGSAETNGKAGFNYTYNGSFAPGTHRVEVRVVSGMNILTYTTKYVKTGPLKGIDVSEHNGSINWGVTSQYIDFAMLRAGWGYYQSDRFFTTNFNGASSYGVPIGIYHYSYALNLEEAKREADGLIAALQGKNIQYPVFIDMEDADGYKERNGMPSNQMLQEICIYFCERLTAAGYTAGVYANLNWWTNRLDNPELDKYVKWVAQWNSTCTYSKPYQMWQYSNNGSVPGISGRVDMNYSYTGF